MQLHLHEYNMKWVSPSTRWLLEPNLKKKKNNSKTFKNRYFVIEVVGKMNFFNSKTIKLTRMLGQLFQYLLFCGWILLVAREIRQYTGPK